MFLRAETLPFLHGHAHAGMVIGAQNILNKTFDALLDAVANNPSYSILVVGYSLGKSNKILWKLWNDSYDKLFAIFPHTNPSMIQCHL